VDLDVFVAAHQAEWARLRDLSRRGRGLTGHEIDELVARYQRTATQLATLQASGLDPALSARLSSQLAAARAAISGAHASTLGTVRQFALVRLPATIYRVRYWWLASAAGSVLIGVLIGWWVARSPSLQASLLPGSAAKNMVQHQFSGYYTQYDARSFAFQVWTNNVWVSAEAIIFGIVPGVLVILVLFQNAANAGVLGGIMTAYGRAGVFWGLILPHGMLELTAVFLAGGAGLRLGWTLIDPGPRSRGRALAETGRETMTIALGLIAVLAVSGAIEAFVTPSGLPAWARIGIGGLAEAAFLGYALLLGRKAVRAGLSGDIAEAPDVQPVAG
jgi:uncharacterized membrane protein SpoIIM required for sporulation